MGYGVVRFGFGVRLGSVRCGWARLGMVSMVWFGAVWSDSVL